MPNPTARAQLAAKGQSEPVLYARQCEIDKPSGLAVVTTTSPGDDYTTPLYLAAPASAQPDRGAAQELLLEAAQFLDDSMFQSAGQAARAENLAAKLRAPSPASQPVAPEAMQANDLRNALNALDSANTLLEHTRSELDALKVAHAQQEAAPTTKPWKDHEVRILVNDLRAIAQAFHATEQLRGRISDRVGRFLDAAVAPSDAKDATLPDHSERGAANRVKVREGAWEWEQRAEAAEAFLRNYADTNMEVLLDGYQVQPIIRRLAAAILEWQQAVLRHASEDVCGVDQSPATIAAGQEAANAKCAARPEDRIDALRTALRQISETTFGWDGDCGVARIADDALYADEQADTERMGRAAGKGGGE
jgi:hypothetical protein